MPANAELGDTSSGSAPATHACGMKGRDPMHAPLPSVTEVWTGWHARIQARWEEWWVGSPEVLPLLPSNG